MSSKNVMGNFASDAVLNERITVQPSLKPGLFDNKRVSKKQPISDLTFSEMQFLKRQRREPQAKPLSNSRLKERLRETRELEQISSFFQPPKGKEEPRKKRQAVQKDREDPRHANKHSKHNPAPLYRPDVFESSPSRPTLTTTHREGSLSSRGRSSQTHLPAQNVFVARPMSSKATSYFTWSKSGSHHSARPNVHDIDVGSHRSDSTWTTTPEPVREALIATGIFKDTGIQPYDDASNQHSQEWATQRGTASDGPGDSPKISRSKKRESLRNPNAASSDEERVAENEQRSQEQRWKAILPHEWRRQSALPPRTRAEADDQLPDSQAVEALRLPTNPEPIDRRRIARKARLRPVQKDTENQDANNTEAAYASVTRTSLTDF
ncbi:Uu.00g043130.m01.CDS01 [Anthostomella pinea]|uniref:Uu.00g043130.m01.CDS01 n=1 Tax=Anthostomella pinea TaxID=933095 RepID=A0AAI8VBN3_9PEZI|nr:Uu.00g043130.m01.CDS01 [Anthostomella pinea]